MIDFLILSNKRGIEDMKTKLILTIMCMVVTLFAASLWAADAPAKKNKAQGRSLTKIDKSTKLAYEGGTLPLTTTPVVGTPNRKYYSITPHFLG
jgi:hypothetical protein